MKYRLNYLWAIIAVVVSSSSAFADITYNNPRVNNRPVDGCLNPAVQCGRPAADRFCEIAHAGTAVRFHGQRSAVATLILGNRQMCTLNRFDHCDRFDKIVCSATRFD